MATLYLHIGTSKTGTTAIQMFCEKNRDALARRGYCFMKPPYFRPGIAGFRNGHFLVAGRRSTDGSFLNAREERDWRKAMDRLAAQFRTAPNVVLSDEGIWSQSSGHFWDDLKAESQARGYDVQVIAYIRRQDQYLSSDWAQRIKIPYDDTRVMKFPQMLAEADKWLRLDYYATLEEISARFGRDHVHARVYDRKRFPDGDIVKDFLEVIGLPSDPEFKSVKDPNSSIYGNALEIKRIINAVPGIDLDQERELERIARACCAACKEEKRSMFTQEECEAFLAKYEDSNRRVARDYLGDESAPLFAPLETLPPKWSPDNPQMYEAIVCFFAIATFARPKERFTRRIRRKLRSLRTRAWKWRERRLDGR